jgi:hypothetical protein
VERSRKGTLSGVPVRVCPGRDRRQVVTRGIAEEVLKVRLGRGLDKVGRDVGYSLMAHGTPRQGGRGTCGNEGGNGENANHGDGPG